MITTQGKKIQKLLLSTVIGIAALGLTNCKKDNFAQDGLNGKASLETNKKLMAVPSYVDSTSYYLINSLPSGYVKDATVDYTNIVQAAILKYPNLVFPNFPILINDSGLNIPSNRTITFLPGSELRLLPSSKSGYNMLSMKDASNIILVAPVLKGDRFQHLGTTGEWGNGIGISGGGNINILSPKVVNMWGDGLYIGVSNGVIPHDISVKDADIQYSRRNGVTIIAVDGLLLESPYVAFTNGTLPMAGIEIEPNFNTEEVKNVVINNPKTEGNLGSGLYFDFGNLMGGGQKKIGVTVNNHVDIKSNIAVKAMSRITDGSGSTIQGELKFVNPKWNGNATRALQTILFGLTDVHLIISDPVLTNVSDYQLSKLETFTYLTNNNQINTNAWSTLTFSQYWPSLVAPAGVTPGELPDGYLMYAINAGGQAFTASNGITYQADNGFIGGGTYQNTNEIINTNDDALYQSERNGTFGYSLPIDNGTYEVTLKFAEIYFGASGMRQFDVLLEGNQIKSNLDIFAAVGKNAPLDVVQIVTVTDGVLNINFNKNVQNVKLSAFHVKKKVTNAPSVNLSTVVYAINAGGAAFTASNGIVYQADKYFSGGNTYTSTSEISNTVNDPLYQTERYGNFSYSLPVTNGTYEVTMKFSEVYQSAVGMRVFDGFLEGSEVFSNLDIFQSVGKNAALDVVRTITVSDGVLNLNFRSDINKSKLCAFHVIKN